MTLTNQERAEEMIRRDIKIMEQQKQQIAIQIEQLTEQMKKLQDAVDEWSALLSN